MPAETSLFPTTRQRDGKWFEAGLVLAVASVVFAAHAWLVRSAGSPLPFWDQWDAELLGLYQPWSEGRWSWWQLFSAHNEHRIALTRLTDLALFAVEGWNPWHQLLVNAVLHAACAAALAALFWRSLRGIAGVAFVVVLTTLFASACGWQNALWGFQSCFCFANLLSVAAIAGLCSTLFSRAWWLGLLAGVVALYSEGSGVLAVAAAFLVIAGLAPLQPPSKLFGLALGLIAGVIMLGWLLHVDVPENAPYRAHTPPQFLAVLTNCLAWPQITRGYFACLMQAPLLWLLFDHARRRQPLDYATRCAVALALCSGLHAAAVAYARGGVLPDARPLSRYQDALLLGAAAQLFAALKLARRDKSAGRLLLCGWLAVLAAGLITLTEANFSVQLPFKRLQDRTNLAIVRAYDETHDAGVFASDSLFHGPHPEPKVVQRALDDPALRRLLPRGLLERGEDVAQTMPWPVIHAPLLTALAGFAFATALWAAWWCSTKIDGPI